MNQYADHIATYKKIRVNTAHPGRIIVMLYDEALKQIDFSIEKLDAGSRSLDAISNSILKAYDIITELTVSLDMEKGGEIATQLYKLYEFFSSQLIRANVKKDSDALRRIRPLIAELRESWHQVANLSTSISTEQSPGVDING